MQVTAGLNGRAKSKDGREQFGRVCAGRESFENWITNNRNKNPRHDENEKNKGNRTTLINVNIPLNSKVNPRKSTFFIYVST